MRINYQIRELQNSDIHIVTDWSRKEGFAPGFEDINIYRNTDSQALWIGSLNNKPIGCIVGIRYNAFYGFVGLYIVDEQYRGKGYGLPLWKYVLNYMDDLKCIGLEAAPNRINDYSKWGFRTSSVTTRWKYISKGIDTFDKNNMMGLSLLDETEISHELIQNYDDMKEETSRPHFLSDWMFHRSGNVTALVDSNQKCLGFGRIRPCLLKEGSGWRVGPLIADKPEYAKLLLKSLLISNKGTVYIDSPGLNPLCKNVLKDIGFVHDTYTVRMYKGEMPSASLSDIYGLACLELG